ncbi:LOW QUALITY PROTEIN: armadillo-type protein, partial [Jimgerdemannia flammicorona]
LEIVRLRGLPPLLRLLKSTVLPLILSSVACIRNISIHPLNELPIIEAGFLHPLIDLLAYNDNEEIQCHAISTLRNLAASSERNKREIVEAGAVEKIKTLLPTVPVQVQSEMTAALAVLALSEELKPRLLGMHVLDVLVGLTASESVDVQGNSAAAIGNLSSKGGNWGFGVSGFHAWEQPSGGIHGYLARFLDESQEVAFQHIAVWTIVQFIDGGGMYHMPWHNAAIIDKRPVASPPSLTDNPFLSSDPELLKKIKKTKDVMDAVQRLALAADSAPQNDMSGEDVEGDMYALARRVMVAAKETAAKGRVW